VDFDEYQRMAAASENHWWYQATRTLLDEFAGPHLPTVTPQSRYLDAGGGNGATGTWLSRRGVTVIDDYEMFALSAARTGNSNYVAVRADINQIPHRTNSFDAVLCVTALCHQMNPDPQATVAELARVTKPGGIVCLMEPGVKRLWRGHDVVTHTARRFSLADMRALVHGAGLELVRATGAYSFLIPAAAVLQVVERGKANSDVGRNESGLGGTFATLAQAERAWLRHRSLPAGLSVLAIGRKPA
jgi:SAM-dependent methyltransferase